MTSGGSIYVYQNGQGTNANPAVYKSGGGNGACNAHDTGFTGTITIGDDTCSYDNGQLIPPPPLPVTLHNFTATAVDGSVRIEFITTAEVANDFFLLERQGHGENWVEVKRFKGSNFESGYTEYNFIDRPATTNTYFYRLSQTDIDGTTRILGLRSVNLTSGKQSEISIYPNPASQVVHVELPSSNIQYVDLVTLSGQLLKSSSVGQNFVELHGVSAGLYILKITEGSGVIHTRKVVINN
jgi:hypothetical protein